MSGTLAVLPIKAFSRAKSRLATVLAVNECECIARHMATDVLRTLADAPGIDRILVLGQGAEQKALAERFGCDYASDDPTLDISANLSRLTQLLEIQSATQLLIVPADMPLLRSEDFVQLLRGHEHGVTICRASRDGGTNVFLATPPKHVTFSFGSGSAKRHTAAARAVGYKVTVIDDVAFQRDIDTPEDLQWLCRQDSSCDTAKFLLEAGVANRLSDLTPAAAAL